MQAITGIKQGFSQGKTNFVQLKLEQAEKSFSFSQPKLRLEQVFTEDKPFSQTKFNQDVSNNWRATSLDKSGAGSFSHPKFEPKLERAVMQENSLSQQAATQEKSLSQPKREQADPNYYYFLLRLGRL